MKIAVIGASGFVGTNLVNRLLHTGHSIRCVVHRKEPCIIENDRVEFVKADIHNLDSLVNAFKGVDILYHLVGIIAETPTLTFEKTVIQGTKKLVQACQEIGVERIIYISYLAI